MEDLKKQLSAAVAQTTNDTVVADFKKLTTFIDSAITQSFGLSDDERASFLISNLLNMRDYMSTAIVVEQTKLAMEAKINNTIDNFFNPPVVVKKKEESLEATQQNPENISEIDRSML
tara:strand:+ start:1189 stop:1542 length:354 start_codon:yes stop_codon:yes gene_type:complete